MHCICKDSQIVSVGNINGPSTYYIPCLKKLCKIVFWQEYGKEAKIMRGALISTSTKFASLHYRVKWLRGRR